MAIEILPVLLAGYVLVYFIVDVSNLFAKSAFWIKPDYILFSASFILPESYYGQKSLHVFMVVMWAIVFSAEGVI